MAALEVGSGESAKSAKGPRSAVRTWGRTRDVERTKMNVVGCCKGDGRPSIATHASRGKLRLRRREAAARVHRDLVGGVHSVRHDDSQLDQHVQSSKLPQRHRTHGIGLS